MKNLPIFVLCVLVLGMGSINAQSCPFCTQQIIEEQTVFETEYLRVLIDFAPRLYGHLLVAPKRHMMNAHEMTDKEWKDLSHAIPRVVSVFSQYLGTDQYIVLEKNGPQAYQQIPHVHFHLLPMHAGASWREIFDQIPPQLSPEELAQTAAKFRQYFLNTADSWPMAISCE